MTLKNHPKRRLALYLITPILVGLGGIVFSQQWENIYLRFLVLLVSIAIPLFAGGSLWARYQSSRLERAILLLGICMLIVGAVLSLSNISNTLQEQELLPKFAGNMIHSLGGFSLLLGLFVVLYTVVRAGEDINEIGERFQHLAELISEGFIMNSADGTIILVNNQFLDMFDFARKDVLGQNAREIAERFNVAQIQDQLQQRAKGVSSEYEVAWRVRGEERRFWFNGRPIFDSQGRHNGTIATVRDVTELHRLSQRVERYAKGLQKLVEEQTQKLHDSEERFRQLLVSMNEGFLTIDTSNKIRFANERICKMLKSEADALLDKDLFAFVDPLSRGRMMNLLVQGPTHRHLELRQDLSFLDSAGSQVPVMVAVAYLRGRAGQEPLHSIVVSSMAEQKEMQHKLELHARELERANEELRSHGRAKDTFLSNVSHELRTPLSTIQGYVEMLESGSMGPIDGPQTGVYKVVGRNVDRLIALINEMIEFSRMEIRGVRTNMYLFSPERLIRESVASVHPQATAKDITVNIFAQDQLSYAWGDREKLGQVLGILLNNAVKFTEMGGMITVRIESGAEGMLLIAVSDTGIGIDTKFQSRIFEKFYQVDSSKTRRYEGAGIGLSIAKAIVEAHKGSIEVESMPGQGSIFTLLLPNALFKMDLSPKDEIQLSRIHVLVMDPAIESYQAISNILMKRGCKVTSAPNGYECIRAVQTGVPEVILINDSQDDLAGLNTLAVLKQDVASEGIPVIVLSGESASKLKEAGNMWRDVMFIRRPFRGTYAGRSHSRHFSRRTAGGLFGSGRIPFGAFGCPALRHVY